MPERWTRAVLRYRVPILLCWLAVLGVGVVASIRLPGLLSNTFTVPGTDSDRARIILAREFGERPDGVFTVVFSVPRPSDRVVRAKLQRELNAAAAPSPPAARGRFKPAAGFSSAASTRRSTCSTRRATRRGCARSSAPAAGRART